MNYPLLNIQNSTVSRGGKRILDNISLTIPEGQHTAIVGPNGSGKSSLIKLITRRFYPLAAADQNPIVEIFGQSRWDIFELQSMMGILSPEIHSSFTADPDLDAIDTVLSGFFASQGTAKHHTVTDEMRHRADSALHEANAHHLRDRRLATMSTGEVRRVLIARALVSQPKALLLDEPTTGLDLGAMRRFLATIRQVAQHGKTILLVTHHIEEIIPEIERVILMADGKIVADGGKAELLTTSTLSNLFGEPVEVQEHNGFYSARIT